MKGCGCQIHPSSKCGEVCYSGKIDYCSNCEKEVLVEEERNRIVEIINNATMYAGTNNNGVDRKEILRKITSSKQNAKEMKDG